LRDGPGHGHPANCQQLLDVKLKPNAEHQENDADLRQLFGELGIGHEARCMRANERSREQVANNGRESEPLGNVAKHEGGREPSCQSQNQIVSVHNTQSLH
jgi:hypothetical protein